MINNNDDNNNNVHAITPSPTEDMNWDMNGDPYDYITVFVNRHPVYITVNREYMPSVNINMMTPFRVGIISPTSKWEYSIPDGLFILVDNIRDDNEFERIIERIPDEIFKLMDDNRV